MIFIRILFIALCALLGVYFSDIFPGGTLSLLIVSSLKGGIIGVLVILVELGFRKVNLKGLVAGFIGLVIGLLLSGLVSIPLKPFIPHISLYLNVIFAYLGIFILVRKKEEFYLLKSIFSSENMSETKKESKVLDTSVIIDGRIADICKTGFVEGILVIPRFVLQELQQVADSSDALKRSRGRRGLDILNKMQKDKDVSMRIEGKDFPEIKEVDRKLIKLAKVLKGKLVTNDFNLNKVAELEEVSVMNINELANSLKPVVLPGEEMSIQVMKKGKEPKQGVAYLDDGTMVIIEEGGNYIGKKVDVEVSSILQTTVGRMIFTKLKNKK